MSLIATEVEVWTEPTPEGEHELPLRWTIRIDGQDHGGGWCGSHSSAHRQAADYLRDLEHKALAEIQMAASDKEGER